MKYMKVDEIFEIKDNDFLRQFEANIKGETIILEYSDQPRQIFLTKLIVNEEMKNQGIDQLFLKSIFEKFSEERKRVVPTCPEVARFFKTHKKEYKDLLPVGINI